MMCDVRFLAFFWVSVRWFRKWPFGPVSARLGRFRSGAHRSPASWCFRAASGRGPGGSWFRRRAEQILALLSTKCRGFGHHVGPCFWSLSSSVRVRLTFRPFVAWLASSCRSRYLRSCPMGGVLWFVGACGSCRPGSVAVGRSDRSVVRLPWVPWVPCRVGRPGSWLALPGFVRGGAIMCDIGFLGAVRFFGRLVVRVAVPGGPGKFGFCSFGFCSVRPLSYQSTN